jgi:hypothetical protein
MGHPERVCRICGEAGERMASLVCLAPRNLRQRSRWRRLGVDYLAPTRARSMGISNGAAKSAPITANALDRALTSSRLHSSYGGHVDVYVVRRGVPRVPRRSDRTGGSCADSGRRPGFGGTSGTDC